jgi:hypothetical protein
MGAREVKQIIHVALFNPLNAHAKQPSGTRSDLAVDESQGNAVVEAVYTALRNAGVLKDPN